MPMHCAPNALRAGHLAVALAGQNTGSRYLLPPEVTTDDVFSDLLAVAEHERVLGAMAEAVVNGHLPLTDRQHEQFSDLHQLWSRHALDVEAMLVRFSGACVGANIDLRVLKGVALAHIAYDNPSFRLFGDLDVLVPSTRFDEAVQLACIQLGGKQSIPELRDGFDREFGKEALVRVGRIELDLHRTFVTGPFGLMVDLDELFTRSSPFTLGGQRLHALDRAPMLLHACYNAALGDFPPRLGALRDLALLGVGQNLAEVGALADHWRANPVVQRAAVLTVEGLGLRDDHPLTELARLPVRRREQWLLQSYLTSARTYSRPLASLAVIPGISARIRYAHALVAPSREYLRSKGWTQRSHLQRARARLLRRG
jgi:hypothetical protein